MSTDTRRLTRPAAPADWRLSAACQGIDTDTLFSDRPLDQAKVQGICRGCYVRDICLEDTMGYESSDYTWGVAGGLTHLQRRALRIEALLGQRPNLEQARVLASPTFAGFMHQWLDWPADTVAARLRALGVVASPVTVRVALWWSGGKGSVLPPMQAGDRRVLWEQVRDECRQLVGRLRERGVGRIDIAAYLGVSVHQVEQAIRSWNSAEAAEEVRAA